MIPRQIQENYEKLIIPFQIHENREIRIIPNNNHENHESIIMQFRIMKIIKFLEFHSRINKIMKI